SSGASEPEASGTRASARAADAAGRDVARHRLVLLVGALALDPEEALVERVVDEVPGQDLVVGVGPAHVEIGIDALRRIAPARAGGGRSPGRGGGGGPQRGATPPAGRRVTGASPSTPRAETRRRR